MSDPIGIDSKTLDLHSLPLGDLQSWFEMNPPQIPWAALTNVPFAGIPFASLEQYVVPSTITGFSASLGPKLVSSNYAHLLLLTTAESPGAGGSPTLQFNADTSPFGTNYGYGWIGSGTQTPLAGQPQILIPNGIATASGGYRAASLILVPNFLESGKAKSVIGISTIPGGGVYLFNGSWAGTAPITQFDFSWSNNIAAGSTFSAYALGAQS